MQITVYLVEIKARFECAPIELCQKHEIACIHATITSNLPSNRMLFHLHSDWLHEDTRIFACQEKCTKCTGACVTDEGCGVNYHHIGSIGGVCMCVQIG